MIELSANETVLAIQGSAKTCNREYFVSKSRKSDNILILTEAQNIDRDLKTRVEPVLDLAEKISLESNETFPTLSRNNWI